MSEKILKEFAIDTSFKFKECINTIMNSVYFRKLADKTQVIISLSGPNVRTRLTHTVEVARIARDLSKELGLNEALAEAIALAHDIGHTPFGHVGERTLKEIMCGCDTLDGKVKVELFNYGFKHNLQSFKLLLDILKSYDGEEKCYILWGVANHSDMSWRKSIFPDENEISIHSGLCNRIIDCCFSKPYNNTNDLNPCKRNWQSKNDNNNSICRPWLCCDFSKEDFSDYSKCKEGCYFSDVWKFKKERYNKYIWLKYLFDFPFLNSTYVDSIYSTFCQDIQSDFLSFEAAIVSIADEIAQRKQDLDDGLYCKLIEYEEAKCKILDLCNYFISENDMVYFNTKINNSNKQNISRVLEEILINIYIDNIKRYKENEDFPPVNSLYKKEFSEIIKHEGFNLRNPIFLQKKMIDSIVIDIDNFKYLIYKINEYIKQFFIDKEFRLDSEYKSSIVALIIKINKDSPKNPIKKLLLNISKLLCSGRPMVYIKAELSLIIDDEKFKEIFRDHRKEFDDLDFMSLNKFISLLNEESKEHKEKTLKEKFNLYKRVYKTNANQGIMNYVIIDKDSGKKMKDFNSFFKNTILKSEVVEKNDSKSTFIIKKLFEAYTIDPHSLKNDCLESVWKMFLCWGKADVIEIYETECKNLINEMPPEKQADYKDICSWEGKVEISKKFASEIKSIYEKKEDLKTLIEKENTIKIFEIRDIIENPILIASVKWKQAVYRGICDFIAGLTDREALSEYEKLYFTTVELS